MRLVIESRGKNSGGGLNRYQGQGIYKLIGRKVFLSGLKEVINSLEKENHSQNIADAVVNGRSGIIEKKKKKDKIINKPQAGAKRKSVVLGTLQPETVKARKYSNSTTEKIVNSTGFGTVLD
jgi:hypothetical protein